MIKASQLVGCLLSSLLCVEVAFAQDPSAGQVTIPGYSPNGTQTQQPNKQPSRTQEPLAMPPQGNSAAPNAPIQTGAGAWPMGNPGQMDMTPNPGNSAGTMPHSMQNQNMSEPAPTAGMPIGTSNPPVQPNNVIPMNSNPQGPGQ